MKNLALLTTLLFACALFNIPAAHALTIKDIRFGHYPDKTRLVIDLDQNTEFRSFVLSDPYRMVIDLPSFTWQNSEVTNQSSAGITAVRHGNLKPGISRIVFDLNRPVAIHKTFTLPAGSGKPNRLVIDFANTNDAGFATAQKNILGTLNVNNTPQLSAAAPPPKPQSPTQKPLIIIDPGHGGMHNASVLHEYFFHFGRVHILPS